MTAGGLFITLYDIETLELYLQKGIYAFLMTPQHSTPSSRSKHFHALADYSCSRDGTHIFFFLERQIIYGGQIIGSKNIGSFYINGIHSPLGQNCNAPLFWDESIRYIPTNNKGIFQIDKKEKCQPYVLFFEDKISLQRKQIISDKLYFELGKFAYPLPSNAIRNMGFCTMSPGETSITLNLLQESDEYFKYDKDILDVPIKNNKLKFKENLGLKNIEKDFNSGLIVNEAHLEASILANPTLLPQKMRPKKTDILCRQIPISPFKPYQVDRADICYYNKNEKLAAGTIPNTIIELKKTTGNKKCIEQLQRYLSWLKLIMGKKFDNSNIKAYLFAPKFSERSLKNTNNSFSERIELVSYNGDHFSLEDF